MDREDIIQIIKETVRIEVSSEMADDYSGHQRMIVLLLVDGSVVSRETFDVDPSYFS